VATTNLFSVIVLGGRHSRVHRIAEWIAKEGPYLKPTVRFGTEGPPAEVHRIMASHGIPRDRYIMDYRGWDTLSTFTELCEDIELEEPLVLYVATDQYHLRRSYWTAKMVFLFSYVEVEPLLLHTDEPGEEESVWRALRDAAMGLFWACTGINLASRGLRKVRWPLISGWAKESEAIDAGETVAG
jgi:hypothetical protein